MLKKVNKRFLNKYLIIIVTLIVTVSAIGFSIYQNIFYISIDNIPKGEFVKEVTSPNGQYSINIYLVNGGATVDYAIRGELVYIKEKRKSQNIYWNYNESSAEVNWIDDNNVWINAVPLNVLTDRYDYRLVD
ncbi:DUF5412 family protein [Aminipila sp.]|uniref:DUF5412 family protein n=1 Tax=Aminipila sp. TaxID=2060095 RepID=UPI00289B7095|nr:DUF5412 family protein [Aminipila sp.]